MSAKKIAFVLISPMVRPLSSTRISVLNMLPYLRAAGWEVSIAFEGDQSGDTPDVRGIADDILRTGATIAYFQKVRGPSVVREANALAQRGVRTVYGVCDLLDNDMAAACDVTIAVTDYLKSLYDPSLHHKIHVVHDGIERADVHKSSWRPTQGDGRVRAILVNSLSFDELPVIHTPPRFVDVTVIGKYPFENQRFGTARQAWRTVRDASGFRAKSAGVRWALTRPFRKVNWRLDTMYDLMLASDVGIIPVEPDPVPHPRLPVPGWQVKSENRLTLKMALGLPVIASPVPSYLPIIQQGQNGYIARSRPEWLQYLEELRDPAKREAVGRAARASVLPRFSEDEQARRLIAILDGLGA